MTTLYPFSRSFSPSLVRLFPLLRLEGEKEEEEEEDAVSHPQLCRTAFKNTFADFSRLHAGEETIRAEFCSAVDPVRIVGAVVAAQECLIFRRSSM